jgi:uncharacterized protein YcbK (DUF882 family)
MKTKAELDLRRKVMENFVVSLSQDIPMKLHQAIWAGTDEGKRKACDQQAAMMQEQSVLRMAYLLGDITREELNEKGRALRDKIDLLQTVIQ